MTLRSALKGACAPLALSIVLLSQPALAQNSTDNGAAKAASKKKQTKKKTTVTTPTTKGQEIIVTGSRLATINVTDQPVETISGETITSQGYTNVGAALTDLPTFGVPGNSARGAQGSFGAGQTFVNLYDLGAQRTLTLVNGNRFVSSGSSSIFGSVQGSPVDLSQIAPGLVQRIDIVSVGGAPIYGSDAIAGTVNIILKKDYQGLSLTGSAGASGDNDAQDYNVSLLAGKNFNDGRGNITVNLYYDHQNGLTTAQRAITNTSQYFNGTDPSGKYTYARFSNGFNYTLFTNTGFPLAFDYIPIYGSTPVAAFTNTAGQPLYFNKSGQLTVFNQGTALANGITQAGGDGFTINDYGNLLVNSRQMQGVALLNYEFSSKLRFHGELWVGQSKASNKADQPYYNTWLFNGPGLPNGDLVLSTSNPFLSTADQQTIQTYLADNGLPTDQFYMARANTDIASGAFTTTTNLYRGVLGLTGDFSIGQHNFTWEARFNYGQTYSTTKSREIINQNFNNALNAVLVNGQIQCATPYTNAAISAFNNTCAPLDLFGLNNASQAAIDYIEAPAKTSQIDTQIDFVADVKGDILRLPGGDVNVVLGYEHRRESQSFNPGTFFRGQLVNGQYVQYGGSIPITPVAGNYSTNEGFGQLQIPLVSPDMNVPLIHSMSLNGAARYTDNTIAGGFWSYTAGGNYAPVAGLSFRGNYTRSFRSPSITELFSPIAQVYELANDPCDSRYINDGPNPSVRAANCSAAGITQPFQSNIVDYTVQGRSGGNPNLQNELAKSWTAGVVLAPEFLRGFKLTSDYVSIDISNEIASPGMTALLDACYDSPSYPNVPACSTFTRDSSGQITNFLDSYTNIAIEKFHALQTALAYRFPLTNLGLPEKAGALNLNVQWLHTFEHYYKVGQGDQQLVLGARTAPEESIRANIDWATKKFDWMWTITYYSKTQVDPNAGPGTYEYPTISPYMMYDTSIGYRPTEHLNFRLIVNNVFDKGIPFPYTSYSTSKYFSAIMGRYFRLNATYKF